MLFKSNDRREVHARQITKRAMRAAKQMWSIGDRKFNGDFRTRMMLFDCYLELCCRGRSMG